MCRGDELDRDHVERNPLKEIDLRRISRRAGRLAGRLGYCRMADYYGELGRTGDFTGDIRAGPELPHCEIMRILERDQVLLDKDFDEGGRMSETLLGWLLADLHILSGELDMLRWRCWQGLNMAYKEYG